VIPRVLFEWKHVELKLRRLDFEHKDAAHQIAANVREAAFHREDLARRTYQVNTKIKKMGKMA
jgi:hypothetical protein